MNKVNRVFLLTISCIAFNAYADITTGFQTYTNRKGQGLTIKDPADNCGSITIVPLPKFKSQKIKVYAYLATGNPIAETLRGSAILPPNGNTFNFDWAGFGNSHYRIFTKQVLDNGQEQDLDASQTISYQITLKPCYLNMDYGELKMNARRI